MRKIISYIFILIILVGFLSPAGSVSAQATPQNCTIPDKNTRESCIDAGGTWTNDPAETGALGASSTTGTSAELKLGCSNFLNISLSSCVAQISYIIWSVSALVARLAGHFLDFFVYYSTDSASYDNDFVEKGWAAVRDVANIFFIISLLYVAVKMALSLDDHGGKKLISYVIIIALIINFSLFITKVVIDGSNILAKVFYNNITPQTENPDGTIVTATGSEGQKSISIGVISKFNPQNLVTQSVYDENRYTFIFMTLVLTGITLYTAYIFFSVALLFLARVISIWILMIFSPVAFISYAVPFDIPGFGHKEWWSQLLKNAFLAPIYIFFLFIIILFTGFLKNIIDITDSADVSTLANLMQRIMSVTIPFVVIAGLLKMSKKLAQEYSGEMGQAVIKAGQMVGGLALGAATGGAALAGRATLGRAGAALANSAWAKRREAEGRFLSGVTRSGFKALGSGSFDLRGIKVAGQSLASTGLKVGSAQEGGFTERRKAQVAKRQERAKELAVGEDETLKQDLNRAKEGLEALKREGAHQVSQIDGQIKTAIEASNAARAALNAETPGTAGHAAAQVTARNAAARVQTLRQQRSDIKNANGANAIVLGNRADAAAAAAAAAPANADLANAARSARAAANVALVSARSGGHSMNDYEDEIIPEAEHHLHEEDDRRQWAYADTTERGWTQFKDFVFSGGQHSFRGAREAAHNIRTKAAVEGGHKKKKKDDHGHPPATTPAPAAHPPTGGTTSSNGGGPAPHP